MKKENLNHNLNLDCFTKFIGHNVFIRNEGAEETFLYSNLQIDCTTYNCLVLIDGNNKLKTFIPFDSIYNISNINDDLYSDKISISAVHYDWKIICAEERFIYPRCFKCGKEILVPEESIYYIHGNINYNSQYDSPEEITIINSLSFCDDCVYDFVGDLVDEVGEYNE